MRITSLLAIGILCALFGCSDKARPGNQPEDGDAKYREVMKLPVGIEVIFSPEKVYAEKGGRSGYPYSWVYKTSVRSTVGDLSLIEFGGFSQDAGKWILMNNTGKPFTPENFTEWYSCPDAVLVHDQEYSDPHNWTGAESLQDDSNLWYFIAENSKGERFKGVGRVDILAKLNREESAPSKQ